MLEYKVAFDDKVEDGKNVVTVEDVNNVLEKLNTYIIMVADRKVSYYISSQERDVEIGEIVQQSRIKLWRALQKGHVVNPPAYASTIVSTQAIDMQRRRKPLLSLDAEDDAALFSDNGAHDPQQIFEQEESLTICQSRIVQAVQKLPPRQMQAFICSLHDRPDVTFPLLLALEREGIDVTSTRWPIDKAERQRLRASLSVARNKLRQLLGSEVEPHTSISTSASISTGRRKGNSAMPTAERACCPISAP